MARDEFTKAYIECALWSSTGDQDEPLDELYDVGDISRYALVKMEEDCRKFQEQAGEMLDEGTAERAGHDFWLTRNGHGAGFWDGDWPINGDKLTELAKGFGECYLYVTDDGDIDIL